MMEVEAAFTKAQLKSVFALKGTTNTDNARLGEGLWSPGHLLFLGFVGRLHEDGLYHGVCRFEPEVFDPDSPILRMPFTEVIQWINREAPTETPAIEEQTSDGIQSDDNEEC